jgi:serine/threonine protein kinase/WD40 repeat protein
VNACPSDDQLQLLLSDALDEAEIQTCAVHLESCSRCQQVLEDLLRQSAPAGIGRPSSAVLAVLSESGRRFLHNLMRKASSTPSSDTPDPWTAKDTLHGDGPDGSDFTYYPILPGYEVLEELGRGGMGIVYRARHLGLDRLVALKLLHTGGRVRPEMRERFQAEAQAIARLQHPNIVQVHEIGESESGPYCCLELVEGGSLAQFLAGSPQSAQESARLVAVLARAAHYAHEHGIVHRDLKPANILLQMTNDQFPMTNDQPGSPSLVIGNWSLVIPKISDFGLVRWLDREQGLTQSGAIVGTPSYMPPEQADSKRNEIGPAADVYSLGAILYEMLTGRPPFTGETAVETVLQVLHEEPVPPRRLRPNLSRDLETICLKCLQKEPRRRYLSARELSDDLERFLSGRPILARPLSLAGRFGRWCRRNPTIASLILALLLVLVSGVGAVTWKWLEAVDEANAKETARAQEAEEKIRKEAALDEAESNLYPTSISLAHREWRANNLAVAEEFLLRCPPRLRHWEWHYLKRLVKGEGRSIQASRDRGISRLRYSPDGRLASVDESGLMKLWDSATGKVLHSWPSQPSSGRLFFSPDGRLLILTSVTGIKGYACGIIKVWDTASGESLPRLSQSNTCSEVGFGAEGKHMLWIDRVGTIQGKDVQTGIPIPTSPIPLDLLDSSSALAISPNGKLLFLARKDRMLVQYTPADGRQRRFFSDHSARIQDLVISPDSKFLASVGSEEMIRIWQALGSYNTLRSTISVPRISVTEVRFTADSQRLVTLSGRRTLTIWDVGSGKEVGHVRGRLDQVTTFALHPNGKQIALGCKDGSIRFYPFEDDQGAKHIAIRQGYARLTLSHAGHLMASTDNGRTNLGDVARQKLLRQLINPAIFTGPAPSYVEAQFSPDDRLLAAFCQDRSVGIWDLERLEFRLTIPRDRSLQKDRVDDLQDRMSLRPGAFSPGNRLFAQPCWGRTVKVWAIDAAPPRLLFQKRFDGSVGEMEFSPDGRGLVVTSTKSTFEIIDAQSGQDLSSNRPADGAAFRIAFSPKGNLFAVGGSHGGITLYEFPSGRKAGVLSADMDGIHELSFTPDGLRLASASGDRTVRIWDVAGRRELISIPVSAVQVRFLSDGMRLSTVGEDRTVKVWSGQPLPEAGD